MLTDLLYFKDMQIPCRIKDISEDLFSTLRHGLLTEMVVSINYKNADNEFTSRSVLIEAIIFYRGTWYIVAYCFLREEVRTFHIDRIESATATEIQDHSHGIAENIRHFGLPWDSAICCINRSDLPPHKEGEFPLSKFIDADIPVWSRRVKEARIEEDPLRDTFIRHCEQGNLEKIKKDIKAGANVNCLNYNGVPALFLCAEQGHLKICKFLIKRGAQVDLNDCAGNNVFICAVKSNSLEMIKYFIEVHHCDIHAQNRLGYTPLFCAIKLDNFEIIDYLISLGANIDVKTRENKTALIEATTYLNLKMVRYLIKKGADVNIKDKNGKTALTYAVENKKHEMIKQLLKSGANLDVYDRDGNCLLIILLKKLYDHKKEIIKYGCNLYSQKIKETHEILKMLVKKGVNINTTNRKNQTPLMFVCGMKSLKYLIKKGADVNANDINLKTVAMYHAKEMYFLRYLGEHGAMMKSKDNGGNNILFYSQISYWRTKYIIEKYGFSANESNDDRTILHEAVSKSDFRLVKYLVEKGANINAKNKNGHTPIDYIDDDWYPNDNDEITEFLYSMNKNDKI